MKGQDVQLHPSEDPQPPPHVAADADRSLLGRRLVVGVTGHRLRHFGPADLPKVRTAIDVAVGAITVAFDSETEGGQMRLISSLASGADSMAADIAIAHGWTLDAILPIFREHYVEDFSSPAERADFQRQAAAASALLELPGATASGANYERAGRVMLDQCDLLLAVWDGKPARGRGGTEQMLSEAVRRHIPVLLIDAGAERPSEILWTGFDEHGLRRTQPELIGRRPLEVLPTLLAHILDEPNAASQPVDIHPGWNIALAFPLLLAVAGVRGLRGSDLRRPDTSALREALVEAHQQVCVTTGAFGERLQAMLSQYARADATATHMAQLYRGGFIANFAFAATAVLLALSGLIMPAFLRPLLTVSEVAVVVSVLWLTHLGRRRGWHARWIDARHLTERLRCTIVAAQLGDGDVRCGRDPSESIAGPLRDAVRALGLPTGRVDLAYLDCVRSELIRLLDDQIAYQRGNAARMHKLDHRLHRFGTALFILSALSSVCILIFEVGLLASHWSQLDQVARPTALAATLLSASLPAVGGAIYGIRMQGDFSGVAGRALHLTEALCRLRRAVESEIEGGEGLLFDHLRHSIREAADFMGSELADWRTAQQARPPTLPG